MRNQITRRKWSSRTELYGLYLKYFPSIQTVANTVAFSKRESCERWKKDRGSTGKPLVLKRAQEEKDFIPLKEGLNRFGIENWDEEDSGGQVKLVL